MKITTELPKFDAGGIEGYHWDVAFHGPHVDERESSSSEFSKKQSTNSFSIEYSVSEKEISINSSSYEALNNIGQVLNLDRSTSVLIDATTLSVPELFFVIRELKSAGINSFHASYFEPGEYQRVHEINPPDGLCFIKNYSLSNDFSGYVAIPGAAAPLSESKPQDVVFFTGFEAERVSRAFENQNIRSSRAFSIVGIPPFQLGMELSNLSNNAKVFSEFTQKGIYYCPANNPYLAYRLLEKIYRAENNLIIAPVGTKPHGLAAVLFCICNANVGLLYDHPEKSRDRSKKMSRLNIYHIEGVCES